MEKTKVTVQVTVNAAIETVWKHWTSPEDIVQWNAASADWHTTRAENDLRVGGKFLSRMEARDGSFGFDFIGEYQSVEFQKFIKYAMEDGREVEIIFTTAGNSTEIVETFDAESENPIEMQQAGWQCILDNFRKFVESKKL